MELRFYNSTDDPLELFKNPSLIVVLEGEPRGTVDYENPSFVIDTSGGNLDFKNINYMYVPSLERYYFLSDKTAISNSLVQVAGQVDVLMSFQSQIANLNLLVNANTTYYDQYMTNSGYKFKCYPRIMTKVFSNSTKLNDGNSLVIGTVSD